MSSNLFSPSLRYTNKDTCNSAWTFIDGQNVSDIEVPKFIKNLFTSFDDSRYGKMGKDLIEGVGVDCVGSWSACGADCNKTYSIATHASGGGTPCPAQDGDTEVCAGGEGDCPTENTCSYAFEGATTGKDQSCNLNDPDSAGWTKGQLKGDPLWAKFNQATGSTRLTEDQSGAIKALITNNSSMDDSGNPEQMNNEVWKTCCQKAECTDDGWGDISITGTDGSWIAWAASLGCTFTSSDT